MCMAGVIDESLGLTLKIVRKSTSKEDERQINSIMPFCQP